MNLLTIAGSDPTSGAGIQNDIKIFTTLNSYALSVVTCITSQNTKKFTSIQSVSPKMIKNQLDSIFSDFIIDAIKIGVVYDSNTINAIYSKLKNIRIPIIVDPIIKSTTGGILLKNNSLKDYKKFIVPLAYVITPNQFEAKKLSGIDINNISDVSNCAYIIKKLGAKNVVITGIYYKNHIADFILDESHDYIMNVSTKSTLIHGTGCSYSSALAAYIAMGKNLHNSILSAQHFVQNSIQNAKNLSNGLLITSYRTPIYINKLKKAIIKLKNINQIHMAIPECQTNFVYAEPNPKSIQNIIGVTGRIVKSGNNILVAGGLTYGGSTHVATAILEIMKKFPKLRSAINIKYNKNLLKSLQYTNYIILQYDRLKESSRIKKTENMSISFGIRKLIQTSNDIPDIIFHKGDLGKEAMIMVFGKDPNDVIQKLNTMNFFYYSDKYEHVIIDT